MSEFQSQTYRYLAETFADKLVYAREHWSELTERFCQQEQVRFNNFLFTTLLTHNPNGNQDL